MNEHPIEGLMTTAMNSIQDMIDVNTIIGEPIETSNNIVIIPISKVSFGFAAGGSEFKGETVDEYTKRDKEEAIQYRLPFGGGSGAGVTINPIAFLVIQSNNVKLMPVNHTSSLDKLLDYMPDLIEKTNNMMNRCMQAKKEETQKILKEMQRKHDTLIEDYEIIDDSVDEEKKTVHYEASDNVIGDEEVVIVSKETGREKIHFNKYAKYIAAVVIVVLAVIIGIESIKKRLFALKGSYILEHDSYEDIIQADNEEEAYGQPETTQEKAGGEAVMNNEIIERIRQNIAKVIVGKENVIDYYLTALLAQGHILVEDVPGTGKTKLSKAFAMSMGMDFSRIQFTADMLPADITGLRFYNSKEADFRIRKGPIFSNIVLADEINRATPKAQSALLECMEEGQVTIDGNSFVLEKPFMVVATQNQIETAGTYVLPEVQLDRFMLKINMGYPSPDDEMEIINKYYNSDPLDELEPVCARQDIIRMINEAGLVTADDEVRRYIVKLVNETRNNSNIAIGASPRATLALLSAAKANAYINGKTSCSIDDVKNIAVPVLAHRIKLKPKNLTGQLSCEEVINNIVWN